MHTNILTRIVNSARCVSKRSSLYFWFRYTEETNLLEYCDAHSPELNFLVAALDKNVLPIGLSVIKIVVY